MTKIKNYETLGPVKMCVKLKHNCRQTNQHGELVFLCSRCGRCYECKHKLIYLEDANKFVWKCADRVLRPVINDGRLKNG